MPKLTRQTQRVFGSTATSSQVAVFGSLAAGSPQFAAGSPTLIQSLSNWLSGWPGAVLGLNSPAIEDLQAYCYVESYQVAYLLQQGIAEYDGSTTYFQNSIFQSGGSSYTTTYGSAAGISGQTPPNGSFYALLYGISPYNPGGSAALLGFGSGSTALPQPVTQIARSLLPAANRTISSSCGTFITTGSAQLQVTNLSISLTTSGRPVKVWCQADGSGSISVFNNFGFSSAWFWLYRDATLLARIPIPLISIVAGGAGGNADWAAPSIILHEEVPAAGTYTYSLKASTSGTSSGSPADGIAANNIVLAAEEQ